jgi:hypothetical protein
VNILSAVLPGLRALRAPIIAGFLWLTIFLIYGFSHKKQLHINQHDVNVALSAIHTWFVTAVIPTAVTLAYLIGLVITGITTPLLRQLESIAQRAAGKLRLSHWSHKGVRRFLERTLSKFAARMERRLALISVEARRFVIDYIVTTLSEAGVPSSVALIYPFEFAIDGVRTNSMQLAQSAPVQYQEYDRLQAEADFRLGVVPPLLTIALVLPWSHLISLGVAAVACTVLLVQSMTQSKAAVEIVALATIQGYASILPVKLLAEYLRSLEPQPDSKGAWAGAIIVGLTRYGFHEEADSAIYGLPDMEDEDSVRTAREYILEREPNLYNPLNRVYPDIPHDDAEPDDASEASSLA